MASSGGTDVVETKLGKIPAGPARNAETRVRTSKRAAFLNLLYRVAVVGAVVHLVALVFGWLWGVQIWWSIEDALFETPLSRTDNTPGLARLFLWWVRMPVFLGLPVAPVLARSIDVRTPCGGSDGFGRARGRSDRPQRQGRHGR